MYSQMNSLEGYALLHPFVPSSLPEGPFIMRSASLSVGIAKSSEETTKEDILCLQDCPSISPTHLKIRFNSSLGIFELLVVGSSGAKLNQTVLLPGCPEVRLHSQDLIEIPCSSLLHVHSFYFLLPKNSPMVSIPIPRMQEYYASGVILRPFDRKEQEMAIKGILAFGHRRISEIRQTFGLFQRTFDEIFIFSLMFLKAMLSNLSAIEYEEKAYLKVILSKETPKGMYIDPLLVWKKAEKNSGAWTRRLRNLHFLSHLVELNRKDDYDLLKNIPMSSLNASKPSISWSLDDDRALLKGIHEMGYGKFDVLRKTMGTSASVDRLTKRAKKLLDLAREAYGTPQRKFVSMSYFDPKKVCKLDNSIVQSIQEQQWTLEERNRFVQFLMTFGLRRTEEGLVDWDFIRSKCGLESKYDGTLRIFYIALVEEMFQYAKETQEGTDGALVSSWLRCATSRKLEHRLQIIQDLHLVMVENSDKCEGLVEQLAPPVSGGLPEWWKIVQDDLTLLWCAWRHGIGNWSMMLVDRTIPYSLELSERLDSLKVELPKSEVLFRRVKTLLTALKRHCKKRNIEDQVPRPPEKIRKVEHVNIVYKSTDGSVVYPFVPESGLRVLDLNLNAIVSPNEPPFGFHTVRLHRSVFSGQHFLEYDCMVKEEEGNAVFMVSAKSPETNEVLEFKGSSAEQAWTRLEEEIRKRCPVVQVTGMIKYKMYDGRERFGLTNRVVRFLLWELDASDVKEVIINSY